MADSAFLGPSGAGFPAYNAATCIIIPFKWPGKSPGANQYNENGSSTSASKTVSCKKMPKFILPFKPFGTTERQSF